MAKGDVHVVWREEQVKWAVEKEGASRAGSLHEKKLPRRRDKRPRSRSTRSC